MKTTLPVLQAQAISRPVRESLHQGPPDGRVLAVFTHACDLVTPAGEVVALVDTSIGNGPLNVVLADDVGFSVLEPGTPALLTSDRITITPLEIDLSKAQAWEPQPDWARLRDRRHEAALHIPILRDVCLHYAPPESLTTLLWQPDLEVSHHPGFVDALEAALPPLREGWAGGRAQLQHGAGILTGLGVGLTPAGDDFLVGYMLWTWLAHPEPQAVCSAIAETSHGRTTTLSDALLRASARGEADHLWHQLLATLCSPEAQGLADSAASVMDRGATSGADALAGFIWAALNLI